MTIVDMQPERGTYIPIHTSDIGTFKHCRRRWGWSSPIRANLRPATKNGVQFALWFGTGVHYALELHYDPILKRDPVEVFKTWYGTELDRLNEEASDFMGNNIETFDNYYDMGISMLTYYRDVYAPANDYFEVVAAESDFAIPLGFNAIDPRDGEIKPVYYCGKRDAIIRIEENEYAIMDHKTATAPSEDYFTKLEMDEQCGGYLWATRVEAEIYDLPWKDAKYVLYNVLEKGCIKQPSVLQSGKGLSVDRQKEFTTPELFRQSLTERNMWSWFESNAKAQDYLEFLETRQFCRRAVVRRSPTELTNMGSMITAVARDMLNPEAVLYPTPSDSWYCIYCPFRGPCLATNDGSDTRVMLDENYQLNMIEGKYTS